MNHLEKTYKVKKVLNNSSLIVNDFLYEIVILGRGIGFGKKEGDQLPKYTPYDKMYKLSTQTTEFNRIINGFDSDIVEMVMETIHLITEHDQNTFTTNNLISLADHLAAAYTRIQKGEAILTFFTHEIKALYPVSYEKAKILCDTITIKYGLEIPLAEVTYIALHIQNLDFSKSTVDVNVLNGIIFDIENLMSHQFKVNLDKDSTHYARFITHIRFIIESAMSNKKALNDEVNRLIIESYKDEVIMAEEIIKIIESDLGVELAREELSYIVIHLVNIIKK